MAEVAYGFVDIQDQFERRIADIEGGTGYIQTAVQQSAAAYSQRLNQLLSGLVADVTAAQEHYEEPTGGTLQPLDEWGNPLPVQGRRGYKVAYPIRGGGTAFGSNRVSRAMMTVADANRHTLDAQNRDRDWNKRHLIGAAMVDSPYQFFDATRERENYSGLGEITIMPLANGDETQYVKRGGRVGTDNHLLPIEGRISDANNPFEAIEKDLTEHPANQGRRVVAYVATNLVSEIASLAGFVEQRDPDVNPGANVAQLNASLTSGFGDEVHGKVNRVWIVSWDDLPDDYMFVTVDGRQPLGRRQYPAASLQGFFSENHSPDGNIQESRFIRYAGYGVRDRTAALVAQVGLSAGGSFASPEGFAQPLDI